MSITREEIMAAGQRADSLQKESRQLLVDTVRKAARDGHTQREIAAAIGRSQPEVSRLLRFVPQSEHGRILARHRQEVLALAKEHGFSNVRVFGSTARGDDNDDSDIDLLVDRNPAPSMLELGRLEYAVASLLDLKVDLVPANALKPRIAGRVLGEAMAL